MSFPSLPPKLELVVLLVGVAAGYNLTMQILPRERIDLAQLEVEEQMTERAEPQPTVIPKTFASIAITDSAAESSPGGKCLVPPGGGPALNERFEPC
ncbi:hypothetical protein [Synechococcus sp. UW179A]|uniref:hypothetical protein n=1 Tax=Synechococcus sp. UW179A TaxID=2575510 RepID=UPI000E0ECD20|nr:hypothetical protein [Synechococcus sp. UW179A]